MLNPKERDEVEFFVYMEAIMGVFYMVITVYNLISLRLDVIHQKRKGK